MSDVQLNPLDYVHAVMREFHVDSAVEMGRLVALALQCRVNAAEGSNIAGMNLRIVVMKVTDVGLNFYDCADFEGNFGSYVAWVEDHCSRRGRVPAEDSPLDLIEDIAQDYDVEPIEMGRVIAVALQCRTNACDDMSSDLATLNLGALLTMASAQNHNVSGWGTDEEFDTVVAQVASDYPGYMQAVRASVLV